MTFVHVVYGDGKYSVHSAVDKTLKAAIDRYQPGKSRIIDLEIDGPAVPESKAFNVTVEEISEEARAGQGGSLSGAAET